MLVVNQFEGLAPQVDPSRLAPNRATEAFNITTQRGALTALPVGFEGVKPTELMDSTQGSLPSGAPARGLFYSHMADAWFVTNYQTNGATDSLVAPRDKWGRIYFSTENGLRFMTSDQYAVGRVNFNRPSYALGVPAPNDEPTVARTTPSDADMEDSIPQKVFYTYSIMDRFGHEGPLSPASDSVEVPSDQNFNVDVTLPNLNNAAGIALNESNGVTGYKLVYRSSTGSSNTVWQFVGKIKYAETTFKDTTAIGEEAEMAVNESWHPPLTTTKQLEAVSNSFLAGFYDSLEDGSTTPSVICFSMPRLLHAWPEEYRFPVKYRVTAIKASGDGLFVGTTRNPFWCYGADPQAAAPQELPHDYPCLSASSVVDMGGFVVYASNVGLVSMSGQGGAIITEGLFTERDWQELGPGTMQCFKYEEQLLFYSDLKDELYAIDPRDPSSLTQIDTSQVDLKTYLDGGRGQTAYDSRNRRTLLVSGQEFFADTELIELVHRPQALVKWQGPQLRKPPLHFTVGKVQASSYPVTLTLQGSHSGTTTILVESERPFRLPPIPPQRWVQVGVEFQADDDRRAIYEVVLARTVQELRHG